MGRRSQDRHHARTFLPKSERRLHGTHCLSGHCEFTHELRLKLDARDVQAEDAGQADDRNDEAEDDGGQASDGWAFEHEGGHAKHHGQHREETPDSQEDEDDRLQDRRRIRADGGPPSDHQGDV